MLIKKILLTLEVNWVPDMHLGPYSSSCSVFPVRQQSTRRNIGPFLEGLTEWWGLSGFDLF